MGAGRSDGPIERQHAGYRRPGRHGAHGLARTSLMHAPEGRACAPRVAPGRAGDSPYLK